MFYADEAERFSLIVYKNNPCSFPFPIVAGKSASNHEEGRHSDEEPQAQQQEQEEEGGHGDGGRCVRSLARRRHG